MCLAEGFVLFSGSALRALFDQLCLSLFVHLLGACSAILLTSRQLSMQNKTTLIPGKQHILVRHDRFHNPRLIKFVALIGFNMLLLWQTA